MDAPTAPQPSDMLIWQTSDIITRLHGIRRSRWDGFVANHKDELLKIGAIVRESNGPSATKYRVSVMRPWLDAHLDEIFQGDVSK